ncbi:hypothetical protein LTR78_000367 [Recurvomyces mirabilis]|uniref:DUF4211 domain-containing protein n=1 Tax=Recurvomyces mirabilis TaxID=574656 RepID=A0AAE0WYB5_9PEZI|nr:hypothetical protein LTR78_000367 [Recurvomyces mirabilis]KAK5162022.1 hypothetical protein LTS14_000368 [Recurvomyces mirabilis]
MPRSTRAKQSRLEFTPLPSSSPAAEGYHKQIQDRAAAVGYIESGSSSAKRRKVHNDDGLSKVQPGANGDMPTPAATMDLARERTISGDGDGESIESSGRQASRQSARTRRARQQQLDFTRSRDADSFDSSVRLHSSPRPSSSKAGMFGSKRNKIKKKYRPVADILSDKQEDGSGDEVPSTSELRNKAGAKQLDGAADESEDQDDAPVRHMRSSQRPVVVESDDEEAIIVGGNRAGAVEPSDHSDDEDMPTTRGKQSRRKRNQSYARDDFISSSPSIAIDSDDDLEIIEQPRSNRKRRRQETDDDEVDEDEGPKTPGRRKLKRSRKISQREQEDLDEDLDFLGPSSDVEALDRQPRSTQDKAKDARKAALEKLKRQRSGPPETIVEDDEQEGSEDAEEGRDANPDDVEETIKPTSSRQMFAADEHDDDFLESDGDEDGALGVPDGVPIEFTKYASMKPKELFVYAVEWMVQRKINPAFNMNDELYNLTFRKLDDEVQGLAGSKFRSAAWTPKFTMALKNRPEIAYEYIEDPMERPERCDACNRSSHTATFRVQFQGKPYHPHTLEEVGNAADDDDDDEDNEDDSDSAQNDDDETVYDYQGSEVAPANELYYIGHFCMANAETAHNLQHWRCHLNELAIFWLEKEGYLRQEAIVKRDKKSTKKRKKEANKITDRMEKKGEIRRMWEMYRKGIDEARNSKQGRFSAGTD